MQPALNHQDSNSHAHASAGSATGASSSPSASALQRVESDLSRALQHLWTSALIVEQGVAATPQMHGGMDETMQRLMGMAQPALDAQGMTNQNLQQQIGGYLSCLESLDRGARALQQQQLTVPKSVIECVESGHNPALLTQQFIEEAKWKHDAVRAKVFATKLLHDQLQVRVGLWDSALSAEAAAGHRDAHALLHAPLDALRQHALPAPHTTKQEP